MRWLSFEKNGKAGYGVVVGDGVADVSALHPELPDLKAAIASGRLAALGAEAGGRAADLKLSEITYLPVVPNPEKILCVGLNYRDHQAETGRGGEPNPTIFTRFANSQVGHLQPMLRPRESTHYDYEGEIALIIGKQGRRIDAANWRDYVAGFAPYNDGSIRDWQRHTSQFTPGKNFAATGGFGPWMMTPDEVGDTSAMELTTRLNGEVMQHATSAQLVFDFPALLAYCSSFTQLEPGDVIVTGTPGGVGMARTPQLWMKAGDRVEIEVKPIGTLVNSIADD